MGSRGARYYVGTHLGFNLKSFEPMRMVLVSTQRGLGDVRGRPLEWDMGSKVPWAGPWVRVGPLGRVRYQSVRVPRGFGPSGRSRRGYRRVLGLWAKVPSG